MEKMYCEYQAIHGLIPLRIEKKDCEKKGYIYPECESCEHNLKPSPALKTTPPKTTPKPKARNNNSLPDWLKSTNLGKSLTQHG